MAVAKKERLFSWRPLSDEYRASLVEAGLSGEQIAEAEDRNRYTPDKLAVAGWELALAQMTVLTERLGKGYPQEVRAELERRRGTMRESEEVEDRVDAKIIGELIESELWERMGLTGASA